MGEIEMFTITQHFALRRSVSVLWQTQLRTFGRNWDPKYTGGFPKHKELFTDEYYADGKEEGYEDEDQANPYGAHGKDYEDWNEPVYKPSSRGILGTYKKQLNLTATDVMEKEYWESMNNMKNDMASKFSSA